MTDYKKMYYKLFNKITDIIDELQEVQELTEEIYISSNNIIKLSETNAKKKTNHLSSENDHL